MVFDLAEEASHFAQEVQDLLDAVLPGERSIRAVQSGDRYVVRPGASRSLEPQLVPLMVAGRRLASLRLSYQCEADHSGRYLAVETSELKLLSQADRTPLVRLDYLRRPNRAPASHWQVHAERGAFSSLPGWQAAIVEGRERWRRKQIGSVVRDAPGEAVRVLEELGYEVRPPASGARPDRNDRLRQW